MQPRLLDDLLDLPKGEYHGVLPLIHHEHHRREHRQGNDQRHEGRNQTIHSALLLARIAVTVAQRFARARICVIGR